MCTVRIIEVVQCLKILRVITNKKLKQFFFTENIVLKSSNFRTLQFYIVFNS